jgi:hypothetical protein
MNLVQINERLKGLPMQVIQQYANGMNPEVPPYLALGELQRREISQKQMANQGGAQGPQPSVKERVEQKAGLMALQQQQQQQMAEQMMQPRGPLPTSEYVPQPEAQPEPTMMASGGLASVPVQFDFAGGGIVAFNGETGSDVKPKYETRADRLYRENREAAERKKREFDTFNAQISDDPAQVKMREAQQEFESLSPAEKSSERGRRLKEFIKSIFTAPPAAVVQAPMAAPAKPAAENRSLMNRADAAVRSAPGTPAAPPAPIADLKALAEEQKRRQQGPRPTPAAVVPAAPPAAPPPAAPQPMPAPAQPDPNSMDAMLRAQMTQRPKERTLEDELAEQRAARAGAGMGDAAGLAQLERIRKLQEQYESSKPSGLDDLIRVFGQAGQYKGLSGMAPAYTANQQQKRAQDLAMAERINQMMSGVETTQRGEQKEVASGALSGMGAGRTAQAAAQKELMQILSQGRGQDITAATSREGTEAQRRGQDITASTAEAQRRTQERGQDLNFEAAMAQVNSAAARSSMELTQNQRALLADKALDNVNASLKANMRLQMEVGKNPALMQQLLKAETERLMAAASGTTIPAAPGAASPGGTRPPLSSFQR